MSRILNTILLVSFLFSIIYGLIVISKNKNAKSIFKVSLVAMIAFFISRLFFLVLDLSNGKENDFSVGVLGQVAAYLFLMLANSTYLPFETQKQKLDFKALLIILFPLCCYLYCIIVSKTLSSLVCSICYLCSTCVSLYFVFRNLLLIKKDSNYKQLKDFNECILIIIFNSTLENLFIYINNQVFYTIIIILITCVSIICISLALPLLNKEVNNHDY